MAKIPSYPPVYTDDIEQASANLRLALAHIKQQQVAVNPVNYAVWYEYVSGENQALRDAIDTLLQQQHTLTADQIQHMYEKYVLMNIPERLEQANGELKVVVDNTLDNIHTVESTANACISGFSDSQMALENCEDLNDVKDIVSHILSDTQKISDTSYELKEHLAHSAQEIAQLKAELDAVKEVARTDALTGLLNRGAFNQALFEACQHNRTDTALLLFDIDHFKQINDTFGHVLGDKVIQFFAALLQKHTLEKGIAARYGGEEMALILPDTTAQAALDLAEVIRSRFASSRLKKRGSNESIGQVTISAGIAMKQFTDTPTDWIERADQALYQSKSEGRNRITLAAITPEDDTLS